MITCTRFRAVDKGCLKGIASIFVEEWGIEIHNCTLTEKENKNWVTLPSQSYEKDGEKKYSYFVTFKDKELYTKFMGEALDAVKKKRDEKLECEDLPF